MLDHIQIVLLHRSTKKRVYKRHCNIITGMAFRVTGENLICECSYTNWLQQAKKETKKKEGAKA